MAADINDEAGDDTDGPFQLETISVGDTLEQEACLSQHMRCASHTLNLVASTDVLREIQQNNSQLRFQFRKTMGKAQALWNAQGRSTQAADMIKTEIGRKLIVPNVTRWNSTYDSVNLLCELFDDGKRQAVNKVMLNLKKPLEPFNTDDVTFLKEYAKVMAPIAKSLDKLQGEEDAYLGVLLPTIAITLRKLDDIKEGLRFCGELVDAIQAAIKRRFDRMFNDIGCQLASAFHPMFRLTWLQKHDASRIPSVQREMEKQVESSLKQSTEPTDNHSPPSNSAGDDCSEDFFRDLTHSKTQAVPKTTSEIRAQSIVQEWLRGGWNPAYGLTEKAFLSEPSLMQMFCKYNTPVPSSAAVERLFSVGKDVLRAKRASMSDLTLSRLLFLRANRRLL